MRKHGCGCVFIIIVWVEVCRDVPKPEGRHHVGVSRNTTPPHRGLSRVGPQQGGARGARSAPGSLGTWEMFGKAPSDVDNREERKCTNVMSIYCEI